MNTKLLLVVGICLLSAQIAFGEDRVREWAASQHTYTFYDPDKTISASPPSTVTYQINDKATGTLLLEPVTIAPGANPVTVTVPGSANRIVDEENIDSRAPKGHERHVLTLSWTDPSWPGTGEVTFLVQNLKFLPTPTPTP